MYSSKTIFKHSFTLIELMFAMAISTAIVCILISIVGLIEKSMKRSSQIMTTSAKARFVFDRIGNDLKKMPQRTDIDYRMTNNVTREDFLRFITQIKSPEADRNLSLVGYKIQSDTNGVFGIYRGVHGYHWSDIGFMGINAQGTVPNLMKLPSVLNLSDDEYELIMPGVLKVGLAFQYKNDGIIYRAPPFYPRGTNTSITFLQITNISSIVLGMVVMDLKNERPLTEDISNQLANVFTGAPEGITPLPHWNTNLELQLSKHSDEIIKSFAKSIQIYQRFYPLE